MGEPASRGVIPGVRADPVVVEGDDVLLQEPEEVFRVVLVHLLLARRGGGGRDDPPVVFLEPLLPPAVRGRELGDAVEGGLHSARAARFQRDPGEIEPQVDALDQTVRRMEAVVLDEGDPALELRIARMLVHALENALAVVVPRVRLPGEDQLHGAGGIREKREEAVAVAEDEIRALVGREAPRESDRQRIGAHERAGSGEVGRFGPVVRPPAPGPVPHEIEEPEFQPAPHAPQRLGGQVAHGAPRRFAARTVPPTGRKPFVQESGEVVAHPCGEVDPVRHVPGSAPRPLPGPPRGRARSYGSRARAARKRR